MAILEEEGRMKKAINQATILKARIEEFINASAKAGFEGIELRTDKIDEFLCKNSIKTLDDLLSSNKLEPISINSLEDFSLCSDQEFKNVKKQHVHMCKLASEVNCNLIVCVPSFLPEYISFDSVLLRTVERIKKLASLAENYNVNIAFEFLGFLDCSVKTIESTLEIFNKVKEIENIQLVVDVFHFFIGSSKIETLKEIDMDRLWIVHVNDVGIEINQENAPQPGDGDRILPFQGNFNLKAFFSELENQQYNGWVSIELFNEAYWEKSPLEVAKLAYDSLAEI